MNQLLAGIEIIKSLGNGAEKRSVLNRVSIEIGEGEFVSVMGPSGSGKSTLLYTLSGMEPIDSGKVIFENQKLSELSDDELSDLRRNRMGICLPAANPVKKSEYIGQYPFAADAGQPQKYKKTYGESRNADETDGYR